MIDFPGLNQRLLAEGVTLLQEWLPGGRIKNGEYCASSIQGGPGESLKVNIESGKWKDFATDDPGGPDLPSLYARIHSLKNSEAAIELEAKYRPAAVSGARINGTHHSALVDLEPINWHRPPNAELKEWMFKHTRHGIPSRFWPYRDAMGPTGVVVARYDIPGERKQIVPWIYNGLRWIPKAPNKPRPLYGLDRLERMPGVGVIVVEGEPAADSAQRYFPTRPCITWNGGANSVTHADWTPLEGRVVRLLPDNDDPGRSAMDKLAEILLSLGCTVSIIDWLEFPDATEGWDLADAEQEGRTAKELTEYAHEHLRAYAPPITCDPAPEPVAEISEPVTLADFRAYMPMHQYIFVPSGELWPASSVNARLSRIKTDSGESVKPTAWLDKNQAVEQMTWTPGEPTLIEDRLVSNGGWITREGCVCFNLYRPPTIKLGNAGSATQWLDHAHLVFPDDADHIIKWLAHRVQRPGEKINHALVLAGPQGIGKDSLLEPVKYAVGPWNFHEVSPIQVTGRFNGFVKSVILRVNEARDLGDVDRFAFYDHMKVYTATPPDVLRCDEKNLREHAVINVCGIILTTNHKADGIYLPADDRRHYVAWSTLTKKDFATDYWRGLWDWYGAGGLGHVAAYLTQLDLSDFDSKAPPPKTQAFWDIVDANRAPEDAELSDILDILGSPDALTLAMLVQKADDTLSQWLQDRRSRRQIPHRLESVGYVPVRNSAADDGLWKIGGKRQAIYAKKDLSVCEQIAAASELVKSGRR